MRFSVGRCRALLPEAFLPSWAVRHVRSGVCWRAGAGLPWGITALDRGRAPRGRHGGGGLWGRLPDVRIAAVRSSAVLWRPVGRTSMRMAAIGPGCLCRARRWQCRQLGATAGNCGGLGELFGRPENGIRSVSFLPVIHFTSAEADAGPRSALPGRPWIVAGRQNSLERGRLDRAENSASMALDSSRHPSLSDFGATDGCGWLL